MNYPVKTGANRAKHAQPFIAVIVAKEYIFPMITTRGDMVKRARKFKSEWSGHSRMIAENVGMLELTPYFPDPLFPTGHYAQVHEVDDLFQLLKADDTSKDQSYFLHKLNQAQLSK